MSRHWEGENDSDLWMLDYGRWTRNMKVAPGSKNGQRYLRELKAALEAMPLRRLLRGELAGYAPGNEELVCALGAFAMYKGTSFNDLDAYQGADGSIELAQAHGMTQTLAYMVGIENDRTRWDVAARSLRPESPEQTWQRMYDWTCSLIKSS